MQNERSAVEIATIVFREIYKDYSDKEAPFLVKYNICTEAWIVHGTLPANMTGGVGTIGIKKDTGEEVLLLHTK